MNKPTVWIVDDDEAMRDALAWLFESRHHGVACFASAEAFLAQFDPMQAGCLVLDVRMHGMSGLALFEKLMTLAYAPPVIFLTGHGDVPMAVTALKQGAADFVEKPFSDNQLVDLVERWLQVDAQKRADYIRRQDTATKLATLTPREVEVMQLILLGKLNKLIADDLAISMKTVEVHRARIFEKMGVKTAVELAQRLHAA